MGLSLASLVLFGVSAFALIAIGVELCALAYVRKRSLPKANRHPSISLIKPLCGLDDELWENLESHVAVDYPGPVEILLGVRNEDDGAYPLATQFAAAHPDRVRVILQSGEPGHNPKVNQLITLTRASVNEIIVLTDSNVRVPKQYLRELVAYLEQPNVGLASNVFVGVGEQRLGAILDNMTLNSFCAPSVAVAELILPVDQIVGKSLAIPRKILEKLGGWHTVKDVLAEDQQLGKLLGENGLHSKVCPSPVLNVQRSQPLRAFWKRHSRWAMIRYRVLIPGVLLEPLLNPMPWAIAAVALSWQSVLAWQLLGAVVLASMVAQQVAAKLARGYGYALHHLLLAPVRDVVFFLSWVRGATMRWVDWRGTRLLVLSKTRLAEHRTFVRAKNIQRVTAEKAAVPNSTR